MALTVAGAIIGTEPLPRCAGAAFPTHRTVAPSAKRRAPVPYQLVAPEAALRDPDTERRRQAERVLGGVDDDEEIAKRVATLLADASPATRSSAARTLGAMGTVAVPAASAAVCGSCDLARAAAVEALACMGAAAVPEVVRLLRSNDPLVAAAASDILTESVRRVKPEDQKELFTAMGKGGLAVAQHFRPLLSDESRRVRHRVSKVLSCTGGVGAPIVADGLRSVNPEAQNLASKALLRIGSKAVAPVASLLDLLEKEQLHRASGILQHLAESGSAEAESALARMNAAAEIEAEKAKVDISAFSSEELVSIVTAHKNDGPSRRQAAAQLRARGSDVAPLLRRSLESSSGYARWFAERTLLSVDASELTDIRKKAQQSLLTGVDTCSLQVLLAKAEGNITARGRSTSASTVCTVPQESMTLAGGAPSSEASFTQLADRYGQHPTPEAFAAAQVLQGPEFGEWAVESMAALLSDSDERVREAAADALRLVEQHLTRKLSPRRQETLENLRPEKLHIADRLMEELTSDMTSNLGVHDAPEIVFEDSKVEVHATAARRRCNALLLGSAGHAATAAGSGRDAIKSARRLAIMLQDVDPGVRETALRSLTEASGGVYRSTHAEAVALRLQDSDAGVRVAAAMALAGMGSEGEGHAASVAMLLRDRAPAVRQSAVDALARMASARGASQAAVYLKDNLPEVRQCAAEALGEIGVVAEAHAHEVVDLLTDKIGAVRESAKKALPRMGPASGRYVAALLAHPEAHVRALAVEVLGSLQGSGKNDTASFLEHRDAQVRAAAIAALGAIGPLAQEYAAAVSVALYDKYGPGGQQRRWQERLEACRALGHMGVGAVPQGPKVATCLRDREADIRIAAVESLAQLLVSDDDHGHQ